LDHLPLFSRLPSHAYASTTIQLGFLLEVFVDVRICAFVGVRAGAPVLVLVLMSVGAGVSIGDVLVLVFVLVLAGIGVGVGDVGITFGVV
jgi:hypothetical protein